MEKKESLKTCTLVGLEDEIERKSLSMTRLFTSFRYVECRVSNFFRTTLLQFLTFLSFSFFFRTFGVSPVLEWFTSLFSFSFFKFPFGLLRFFLFSHFVIFSLHIHYFLSNAKMPKRAHLLLRRKYSQLQSSEESSLPVFLSYPKPNQ